MKLSINKVDLMPYVRGIVLLIVFAGIVIILIDKNNTDVIIWVIFGLLLLNSFDMDDLKEEIKKLKETK